MLFITATPAWRKDSKPVYSFMHGTDLYLAEKNFLKSQLSYTRRSFQPLTCINPYHHLGEIGTVLVHFTDVETESQRTEVPWLKSHSWPWLVWLSGLSTDLQTKGLLFWIPVRAHAWVVGQGPSRGHTRGNHTVMFLSLSFSLPSLLFKN